MGKLRQAIVVIHGMGEQRPVETLDRFSRVITPEGARFYSRADKVAGSFESRRHLIPRQTLRGGGGERTRVDTQTEIYEYHWAHLMQGNRLDDLWPTFRRLLFPAPSLLGALWSLLWIGVGVLGWAILLGPLEGEWPVALGAVLLVLGVVAGLAYLLQFVPDGLVIVWLALWAGIVWVGWAVVDGPLAGLGASLDLPEAARALLGGSLAAGVVAYLAGRVLPGWMTSSFVDVIRYLDTSPRSLAVRRQIRTGIVDLLEGLHQSGRYRRIVVVAHSLGSYIAYDAISHLWAQMGRRHSAPPENPPAGGIPPSGLEDLERRASQLDGTPAPVTAYQAAQRALWEGIRRQGNPWLVTDLITFGSPMYFADRLYTKNRRRFLELIDRREVVTCPPQNELASFNNVFGTDRFFSWNDGGVRILHEAAPFAVVRWTNLWYRARWGFFGDWFGGPLQELYGPGIRDVAVAGNRPWRWLPGAAHGLYLSFSDRRPGSFAAELGEAIGLDAASWLAEEDERPNPFSRAEDEG
jgi:hypothetical protein